MFKDYVAISDANYLYPAYVLPSNNFYGRVNPNPYYLSNELRNLRLEMKK